MAAATPPRFGLILPGRPVRTDFAPVDATGLKLALTFTCPGDLPPPLAATRDLVLFLATPLPADRGVLVYWQIAAVGQPQEATGFELLGALTPEAPSGVFATGWSEHEQLVQVSQNGTPVTVTIALSVEPLANVRNLLGTDNNVAAHEERRLFVAHQIARDLFQFMQSFDAGGGGTGQMVVPTNIFDRWYKRFENRFRRDPNFFLKNNGE